MSKKTADMSTNMGPEMSTDMKITYTNIKKNGPIMVKALNNIEWLLVHKKYIKNVNGILTAL